MNKIVLYILGQKGYAVARAAISSNCMNNIYMFVIGSDKNLKMTFPPK